MITQIGVLQGHRGWITAIAAPTNDSSTLITASRDKTLIKWDVSSNKRTSKLAGVPVKSLVGHSDFVQDVQVSSDGAFALSGSWDNTLALWDLSTGVRRAVFRGHTNDVTSVAFSPCNRQIVSGSRDRTIKLWNTIADFKGDLHKNPDDQHEDWVSCVRFSPNSKDSIVVSGGHDGKVKVWSLAPTWKLNGTLDAQQGYVTSVCISPDGSLCAAGGKDGIASLWDLNDCSPLFTLGESGDEPINALTFSPDRYWLSVAVGRVIRVYDLQTRRLAGTIEADDLAVGAVVTSLAWSSFGSMLFTGHSDNLVRAWEVTGDAGEGQ